MCAINDIKTSTFFFIVVVFPAYIFTEFEGNTLVQVLKLTR